MQIAYVQIKYRAASERERAIGSLSRVSNPIWAQEPWVEGITSARTKSIAWQARLLELSKMATLTSGACGQREKVRPPTLVQVLLCYFLTRHPTCLAFEFVHVDSDYLVYYHDSELERDPGKASDDMNCSTWSYLESILLDN